MEMKPQHSQHIFSFSSLVCSVFLRNTEIFANEIQKDSNVFVKNIASFFFLSNWYCGFLYAITARWIKRRCYNYNTSDSVFWIIFFDLTFMLSFHLSFLFSADQERSFSIKKYNEIVKEYNFATKPVIMLRLFKIYSSQYLCSF